MAYKGNPVFKQEELTSVRRMREAGESPVEQGGGHKSVAQITMMHGTPHFNLNGQMYAIQNGEIVEDPDQPTSPKQQMPPPTPTAPRPRARGQVPTQPQGQGMQASTEGGPGSGRKPGGGKKEQAKHPPIGALAKGPRGMIVRHEGDGLYRAANGLRSDDPIIGAHIHPGAWPKGAMGGKKMSGG